MLTVEYDTGLEPEGHKLRLLLPGGHAPYLQRREEKKQAETDDGDKE